MVILEFAINPLGQGESVAPFVKRAVEIINSSGLKYEVGAVGTTIEGDLSEVMSVVEECIEVMSKESERLLFTINGDVRRRPEHSIRHKVESVQESLS